MGYLIRPRFLPFLHFLQRTSHEILFLFLGMAFQFLPTIRRAVQNDNDAIGQLIVEFDYVVFQECEKKAAHGADKSGSDLKQEVWLRVVTKIHQFEVRGDDELIARAQFINWLRRTASNTLINLHERSERQRRNPGDAIEGYGQTGETAGKEKTPSNNVSWEEQQRRIRDYLNKLPEETRQLLHLVFYENQSLREAAKRLNLSYECARGLLRRTLDAMGRELE